MKIKSKILEFLTPEIIFLIFALAVGGLLVFLNPPFESPDEVTHFKRAYQVSEAGFWAKKKDGQVGGYVPASIEAMNSFFRSWLSDKQNKTSAKEIFEQRGVKIGENEFTAFPNTALYSAVPYMPQAIGIAIARIFTDSLLWVFYAGRLANLIFYLALVFLAIRITPIYKSLLALIALLPMSLFLVASSAADPLTIGLSFLLVAYILKIIFTDTEFKRKDFLILLLLSIAISLCKTTYLLLPFFILTIPRKKFKNPKIGLIYKIAVIGLSLLAAGIWYLFANKLYIPLLSGIDPGAQLGFLLAHPIYAVRFFIYQTTQWFSSPDSQSIYGEFGWLDTKLPLWTISFIKMVLIVFLLSEEKKFELPLGSRVLSLTIFAATTLLIALTMYLTWTPVASDHIDGLQGRYFLPLLPLLAIFFYSNLTKISRRLNLAYWLPICLIIIEYLMIKTLIWRYYI